MGYKDYRNFLKVVEKARQACENSGQAVESFRGHQRYDRASAKGVAPQSKTCTCPATPAT